MSTMDTATDRAIALQNAEFDAVCEIAKQYRRIELTPVVDDDYPAVRHDYEGAITRLVSALNANGRLKNFAFSLNDLAATCRKANDKWWRDPLTGLPIDRNKGELLALIHSEVSETLEGERKNLPDSHLPHRRMAEVELADVLIRVFDYAGGFGYDLQGAFEEKMRYNAQRADHKPENRLKEGGKKF